MSSELIFSVFIASIAAGTPFVFAALGETVTEKSGVLNLGAEGMMAVGAIIGFIVTFYSHNTLLGVLAGGLAGMLFSLLFAVVTLHFYASQVAAGLALAILGVGLAAFLGKPFESAILPPVPTSPIPILSEIPFFGPVFFNQQWIVYLSWVLFFALVWFFNKTKTGLVVKAIGESPTAADSLGYSVLKYRYFATLFGGALSGMGGTYLSVFYTPLWVEGMVAGRGWIGLALVVFASWKPTRVMLGAYLFGGVMITQLFLQASGLKMNVPGQFLSSLPYVATILVLVMISRNKLVIKMNSPVSLGKPFLARH